MERACLWALVEEVHMTSVRKPVRNSHHQIQDSIRGRASSEIPSCSSGLLMDGAVGSVALAVCACVAAALS
jgi:hypothetical protein